MRKPKPLGFKRGDQVVWLGNKGSGLSLTVGKVTATRGDETVYVESTNGQYWQCKHSFGRTVGRFQENPSPIWRLRHLEPGENVKKLMKRCEQANKKHQAYLDACREMEYDVDVLARDWKWKEINRRREEIPNGPPFLKRVQARAGFREVPHDKLKFKN